VALDDLIETEIGVAVAATAAVVSPRARGLLRRGAVYGLAGAMKAGDVVFGAATSAVRGVAAGVGSNGSSARSSRSTASRGTTSRGTTSRGTTSRGTTSRGTTSRGTTSRGTTSRGTTARRPTGQRGTRSSNG
jgi:hypothetical protein